MWNLWFVFLFFFTWNVISFSINESISNFDNFQLIRIQKHFFLMKDGKKHAFPDRYTFHRMGYNWNSPNVTIYQKHDGNKIPNGIPFPSLWDHHPNMKLLALGNSKCIEAVRKIFPYSNPSVVVYDNEFIITWRSDSHHFRIVWLDKQSEFKYSGQLGTDLQRLSTINLMNATLPGITLSGEDPRLFVVKSQDSRKDDKVMVVFATRYPRKQPEIRVSYIEIRLDTNRKIIYDRIYTFHYDEIKRGKEDQKNWSPFHYKDDQVYFISSGQPHRITKGDGLLIPNQLDIIKAKTVSETSIPEFETFWKYGEVRGGTPAILVKDVYLTFFHSSIVPPDVGDVLRTYVFGAYIFSKEPPFAITAMTKKPIIHETMYTGPWTNLPESYYLIDYVAFPMSALLSADEKYVYVVYGHQDVAGWIAKIHIETLFSSFSPFTTK